MKNSMKRIALAVFVTGAVFSSTFTSLAAWEQVGGQWKYSEDGTYLTGWQWLDGNGDNVAECYYLDANGIMAANTAVDSYSVNVDGAWTVNGVVQTKAVSGSGGATGNNIPVRETNGGYDLGGGEFGYTVPEKEVYDPGGDMPVNSGNQSAEDTGTDDWRSHTINDISNVTAGDRVDDASAENFLNHR